MNRKISLFVALFAAFFCVMQAMAAVIPAKYVGQGWVTLKTDNGYFFYAKEDNGQIKLGQTKTAPTAQNYAAYCWQINGDATQGYTFCCLKYENPDGSATLPENKRYISNPSTLATNTQEVLLTNTPSTYFFTDKRQLQLTANPSLYLAFYSQSYSTIRLHNGADYVGSRMVIGGISDWSVAAVVYGTETTDGNGLPQGTYLPNGGIRLNGQNYVHGTSLYTTEIENNYEIIAIDGYTKSFVKIDEANRYIVAYYVGNEAGVTYKNAPDPQAGQSVVTGENNTIWTLDAQKYITNTSGNYTSVPAGKAWQLEMVVSNTNAANPSAIDPSFNQWGSCILASTSDVFNNWYNGDFQFYQKKDGSLNFKASNGNDHTIAQGHSVRNRNYKVVVRNNGGNVYVISITMLNADFSETNDVYNNVWFSSRVQNNISQMSSALPTGLNLRSLRISVAEESNLLEGVDYSILNTSAKAYLTGTTPASVSLYAADAAKYQVEFTGNNDLTYAEADGALHYSFYLKKIDDANHTFAYLTASGSTQDKTQAQAFVYTTNKCIAPISPGNNIGTLWSVNDASNNVWNFDFFANFYVEVSGNANGGLIYHQGLSDATAFNAQYIELPSGVQVEQLANSSLPGYCATITKSDIRVKVQYTPLKNAFYSILDKANSTSSICYWNANQLISYSTTNSLCGNPVEWGDHGDFSKFAFSNLSTLPIKLNRNTQGTNPDNRYYGSIYLPLALQLPDDVKAYYLHTVANDEYILYPIEGRILPASTPAILVSESNADPSGNWSLTTTSESVPQDNIFSGSLLSEARNPSVSTYVLSGKNGIGFYPYTGTDLPAFKAYYTVTTPAAPVRFVFHFVDDTSVATDISDLPESPSASFGPIDLSASGVCYDLLGRPVAHPVPGHIYICNGKKFLF